jgi:hypothetical protein
MTITLTREEAQQVLDDLEEIYWPKEHQAHKAIETLRARLAQPEPEPVAWKFYFNNGAETVVHDLKKAHDIRRYLQDDEREEVIFKTSEPRKPSGSFVSWDNTMCNPLADMRTMTRAAWEDGYASAIEAKLKEKNFG